MELSDLKKILAELNSIQINDENGLSDFRSKLEAVSNGIKSADEIEEFRLALIAKKNKDARIDRYRIKDLPNEEKPVKGALMKKQTEAIENAYKHLSDSLETGNKTSEIDLTLPGRNFSVGTDHLITQTLEEMVKIFREIGFKVTNGPELEEEFYNFDALNTPEYHPSRDMQDTFYVADKNDSSKKHVLRTHTSPVQIRTMMDNKPPLRIISPGKVYRNETVTYKNYFMFHQLEGLYVDKNVSMRDLKGVLTYFFKKFYGSKTVTRFIPSYFPFTEPSGQVDVSCFICSGKGCKTCKDTGWLEIGGCGMVDPNVFKAVGYDPEEVTGYAFGVGIERIAMMKYGIKDIRIFYQNDLRFLEQF